MVELRKLEQSDREQFVQDTQEAFNYGALEESGCRDEHFEVFEQQPIGHTDDDVSFFDGMLDTEIMFERAK